MIKLNDKIFCTLWGEALASDDQEIYVSEWATSNIWSEDPEKLGDEDLIKIAQYLTKLWDAAHMSVREIYKASGLSQAAFAMKFCMSLRTVEDQCRGAHTPPDYVRLMMIRQLGLLP